MRGGEVIRRARERAALSVQQLADRLGTDGAQVHAWEAGDPPFSTVEQAVTACGTELHLVLSISDPDPHDLALLDQTLKLTVDERLQRLKNYVRFVTAGRAAIRKAR